MDLPERLEQHRLQAQATETAFAWLKRKKVQARAAMATQPPHELNLKRKVIRGSFCAVRSESENRPRLLQSIRGHQGDAQAGFLPQNRSCNSLEDARATTESELSYQEDAERRA